MEASGGAQTPFPFLELPTLCQALVATFLPPLSEELCTLASLCREVRAANFWIEVAKAHGLPYPAEASQPGASHRSVAAAYRAARRVRGDRLSIAWGADPRYWAIDAATGVARLHGVWWLHVSGRIRVPRGGVYHCFVHSRATVGYYQPDYSLSRSAGLVGSPPTELPSSLCSFGRVMWLGSVLAPPGGGDVEASLWNHSGSYQVRF
jgi:hypothetical protein